MLAASDALPALALPPELAKTAAISGDAGFELQTELRGPFVPADKPSALPTLPPPRIPIFMRLGCLAIASGFRREPRFLTDYYIIAPGDEV